jgi:hypothetical protein
MGSARPGQYKGAATAQECLSNDQSRAHADLYAQIGAKHTVFNQFRLARFWFGSTRGFALSEAVLRNIVWGG